MYRVDGPQIRGHTRCLPRRSNKAGWGTMAGQRAGKLNLWANKNNLERWNRNLSCRNSPANTYGVVGLVKSRVADPGGLDPDPTF